MNILIALRDVIREFWLEWLILNVLFAGAMFGVMGLLFLMGKFGVFK
jgi:hypothetical protein